MNLGIESETLFTMTEVIADELEKASPARKARLVALSGPTHAEEVAKDLPSTIVSASKDQDAAKYVQGKISANGEKIILRPGNRVRYTVPQYIESRQQDGNVSIMFRVTDVYKDVYVEVSSGNQVLKSIRKKVVRPGEMQVIELTPAQIETAGTDITVSIQLPQEVAE